MNEPRSAPMPGILIFRFNAPIVFFNASYFRKTAFNAISSAGPSLQWFVLGAIPVSQIDVTGWHTLIELMDELEERQIRMVIAGRRTQMRVYARNAEIPEVEIEGRLFRTVGMAVRTYLERNPDIHARNLAWHSDPMDLTESP